MAGLGAALPPSTDALGQLLSEYTKRVYTSQLQHLKVYSTDRTCSLVKVWIVGQTVATANSTYAK